MALRTLYQSFLDSDPSLLRVIARLWKVELQSSRKADIAAELVTALANAEAIDDSLERLSSEEREALDDLVRHAGTIPWAIFTRRWGQVRAIGPDASNARSSGAIQPRRLSRCPSWDGCIAPSTIIWASL